MRTLKRAGATAAGRAEPCPQASQLHQFRPFLGMTEAQVSAIVREAQGGLADGQSRVLQDLFTVRTDATLGDALDTLGHLLSQVNGLLRSVSDSKRLADVEPDLSAAIWGIEQLIEQAQAALSVVDAVRFVPTTELAKA